MVSQVTLLSLPFTLNLLSLISAVIKLDAAYFSLAVTDAKTIRPPIFFTLLGCNNPLTQIYSTMIFLIE